MTDNEIIKALDILEGYTCCENCAYHKACKGKCVFTETISLINRLQEENERLQETTKIMSAYIKGNGWGLISFVEFCKNLKVEAYKEFAERLEPNLANNRDITAVGYQSVIDDIESLIKEMVGE